jgi:hypothetical protein
MKGPLGHRARARRNAGISIGIWAIALLVACRGQSDVDRAADPGRTDRACTDAVEAKAFECSGGMARRNGDTLFVRSAAGTEETFLNDNKTEAPGGYRYKGRIGRRGYHVIEQSGFESYPAYDLVSPVTGRRVTLNEPPVLSPDSARVVSAIQDDDWTNCGVERGEPELRVWRLDDSIPVVELTLTPFDCRQNTGWGPTRPRWRSPDTVDFQRNDAEFRDSAGYVVRSQRARPILAVFDGRSWRIVDPR